MFRVIVPKTYSNPEPEVTRSVGDTELPCTWRMIHNINRNVQRMMEDVYNDVGESSLAPRETDIMSNSSKYEIKLDVRNYKPEELEVKLNGKSLEIRGKHEEKKDDYGYISREFTRKVLLPENVDAESFECVLNRDDTMLLKAKVSAIEEKNPRKIPIKKETSED